jgi:hypothetical protein
MSAVDGAPAFEANLAQALCWGAPVTILAGADAQNVDYSRTKTGIRRSVLVWYSA